MRMDAFGFLIGTLLGSLILLIFSVDAYLSDIAFVGALLSMALLTVDDWLDDLFLGLFRLVTALRRHHINRPSFAFLRHRPQPFKPRQRWLNEHRIRRFADRRHQRHTI